MGNPGRHWRPLVVDLDDPPTSVATGGATHLYVIVFLGAEPVGKLIAPAPLDPMPGELLLRLIADRFADQILDLDLGITTSPPSEFAPQTATVIVCTKGRPDGLRRTLASIRSSRDVDLEVVVVENEEPTETVSSIAAEFGAVHLSEPLPGLDRARNRGVLASSTQFILFTDDDVEVDPLWAKRLLACFDDPLVAGATGLVLPAILDSGARILSELHASHGRGTRRRELDGSVISPSVAGSVGVGASMAFRKAALQRIGGFPEELDAGMPTGTGGDTYALNRMLRLGYRLIYEPRALAHHWHRESEGELRRAFHGNGNGISSHIVHLLVEDRDPSALTQSAPGAVRYLLSRVAKSILGTTGAPPMFLTREEVAGAMAGPGSYQKARASVAEWGRVDLGQAGSPPWIETFETPGTPVESELPRLSVVIPTRGRKDSVLALISSLGDQDYPRDLLEVVVVVDGDVDGTVDAVGNAPVEFDLTVLATGTRQKGAGPAIARNEGASAASGDVILFLDDDVVPLGNDLLRSHASRHSAGPAAAAGPALVDLDGDQRFFAQRVRNWWVQHVDRMNRSVEPAFTDLCTGNFSIDRASFEKLGGFAGLRRREDWELGYRIIESGIPLLFASDAAVVQQPELDVRESLADRRGEGAGDVGFSRLHPEILSWLPLGSWTEMRRKRRLVRLVLAWPDVVSRLIPTALAFLATLEALGMRTLWSRLLDTLNFASYWSGVAEESGGPEGFFDLLEPAGSENQGQPPRVELSAAATPVIPPGSADRLMATFEGDPTGVVSPLLGGLPWDGDRFLKAAKGRLREQLARAKARGSL